MADLLAIKLAERDEIERSLTRVGPAEREILALAQRAGGEVATSVLENAVKKSKNIAPPPQLNPWDYGRISGDAYYQGKPTLDDVAAHLALIGLAFAREPRESSKQMVGFELGRYLVVPQEIILLLPSFGEDKPTQVGEPARIVPGSARNFQRDLSR